MGARYLTDLAAVLRAWGLAVTEEPGWQNRARGSGGYESGRPTHVMCHHTASNTSPANDVSYIAHGADAAPLSNLYLARTGVVTVIAAGATNTNGSGEDTWGGGVPDDAMNTHAIGIEAANAGTGEPWPQAQTDAYLILCRALCAAYGITDAHVRGHAEWAPGRKIDPAGPPRWATGAATWRMDDFRLDAALPPEPTPTPPPDPEEDLDVAFIITNTNTGEVAVVDGGLVTGLAGEDLAGFSARLGAPVPTNPVVWADLVAKSNALLGRS